MSVLPEDQEAADAIVRAIKGAFPGTVFAARTSAIAHPKASLILKWTGGPPEAEVKKIIDESGLRQPEALMIFFGRKPQPS